MATVFPCLRRFSKHSPVYVRIYRSHLQVKMAPRAALKKVHAAAVRETAGGSGQARRIQQGTNKRAGEQLKRLETRRAHAPPGRPHSRDGVSSGSKGKRSEREPRADPDRELISGSEQEWEGDVGEEEEEAGSEETEEDAEDDDAEAEAEANAKRAKRSGKGKVGEKGKKEEPYFTRKEVEALLQKEREKHHRRATPTPPTRPHGDDEFVVPAPAPSSCPVSSSSIRRHNPNFGTLAKLG